MIKPHNGVDRILLLGRCVFNLVEELLSQNEKGRGYIKNVSIPATDYSTNLRAVAVKSLEEQAAGFYYYPLAGRSLFS